MEPGTHQELNSKWEHALAAVDSVWKEPASVGKWHRSTRKAEAIEEFKSAALSWKKISASLKISSKFGVKERESERIKGNGEAYLDICFLTETQNKQQSPK